MKLKVLTTIIVPTVVLVAGVAALALSLSVRVPSVAASDDRNGQLHIVKDCSAPAPYCTVVSSNLAQIPPGVVGNPGAGSIIIYKQPGQNWLGMLDTDITLFIRVGDWAVGRCTLNPDGNSGLCTFSDGVGQLAGFTARVKVTTVPTNPNQFAWDVTYSFNPLPPR